MAHCPRCERDLPPEAFNKEARRANGLASTCRECRKKIQKNERETHRERYTATSKAYRKRKPEVNRANARWHMVNHPKAIAARDAVRRAKDAGDIVPADCEVCGSKLAVAHHDDYSLPLVVRWLCRRHHAAWHKEHGPGANLTNACAGLQCS